MKTQGRWETSEKFQFLLPTSIPVAKLSWVSQTLSRVYTRLCKLGYWYNLYFKRVTPIIMKSILPSGLHCFHNTQWCDWDILMGNGCSRTDSGSLSRSVKCRLVCKLEKFPYCSHFFRWLTGLTFFVNLQFLESKAEAPHKHVESWLMRKCTTAKSLSSSRERNRLQTYHSGN